MTREIQQLVEQVTFGGVYDIEDGSVWLGPDEDPDEVAMALENDGYMVGSMYEEHGGTVIEVPSSEELHPDTY